MMFSEQSITKCGINYFYFGSWIQMLGNVIVYDFAVFGLKIAKREEYEGNP
jgi:hypothetical protein